MPDETATFDLITMGRSSIDLYSNDLGAPFEEITGFAAYVGGRAPNKAGGGPPHGRGGGGKNPRRGGKGGGVLK
ncbi:MAG: hypothetical protein OXH85_08195, partial [Truepera sp.]|nr:hypothetical protein [Truepera sp.]